jgi:hypothetical protein
MNTLKTIISISLTIIYLIANPALAMHESGHDLSDEEWLTIKGKIELLDNLNYLPTLLPTIMRHSDALELTDEQLAAFRNWRKQNYGNMVSTMNAIIEKRVAFKNISFIPGTTDEELRELQNEILVLQRQLLEIKLTCRKLVMDTFTDEQWENFEFAIADHPRLASFIHQ